MAVTMIVMMVTVIAVMVFVMGGRVPVRVRRLRFGKPELRRRHARTQHALRRDRPMIDRQAPERAAKCIQWKPEIEQRPEDHIAGDAGETIEVQRLAQFRDFPSREN